MLAYLKEAVISDPSRCPATPLSNELRKLYYLYRADPNLII